MFVLIANDMRASQVEIGYPVVRAETAQELLDFLVAERVESYSDGQWGKTFRAGGPLEWYNDPFNGIDSPLPDARGSMMVHRHGIVCVGTLEERIILAKENIVLQVTAQWEGILALPTLPLDGKDNDGM